MSIKAKNILRNIGFLLSIPILIGAFVFAVAEDRTSQVKAIEVDILNPEFGFVSAKDIERSLLDENIVLDHSAIELLDVSALEEKINSNPWVESADVFVTSAQSVKVKLIQVTPKLRVQRLDSTGNGYYLDEKGYMIPLSRKYAADLPILTAERSITTVDQRKELVNFAQFIEQDTFWHAAISQVNLDENNDIELSSLIGNANIRFGSTDNMEDKFFRLFQFYKKGINRINWSNVKELDLRFDKQLVCRRYHKEKHIEERRAPKLYVKQKTKPAEPRSIKRAVAAKRILPVQKSSSVEQVAVRRGIEVPKRRKVVSKKVWEQDDIEKKPNRISAKKKVAKKTPRKTTKKVAKKTTSTKKATKKTKKVVAKKKVVVKKAKKVVAKKKAVAKPKVRTASKASKPKPRKKKREIIINTEPVTKK